MSNVRVVINIGHERTVVVSVDRSTLARNLRVTSEHARKLGLHPGEAGLESNPLKIKGVKESNQFGVINIMSHDKFATIYTAARLDVDEGLQKSDQLELHFKR